MDMKPGISAENPETITLRGDAEFFHKLLDAVATVLENGGRRMVGAKLAGVKMPSGRRAYTLNLVRIEETIPIKRKN